MIDGNWGFGYVVTDRAMRYTIDKAKKQNVAAATVYRQSHIGRLASYPLMAAREGMIAMITADSGRSAKAVAPFGGAKARLGTNPICFAMPSNLDGPLFFDMATSAAAAGKINVATARGEQVPAGWLIDAEGKPSTDPRVLRQGGALLPVGGTEGYKGYGLATIVEILSGLLTGLGFGVEPTGRHNDGCFIAVFNVVGVPRPEHLQAGSHRVRPVPEGHAAGAGLHRSALSGRDRIQPRAGPAQERHPGGGRHLEEAAGTGARLWPRPRSWDCEPMADLVIRNGTVIDGTGAEPFEADVAIDGGKITAVGKIAGRGIEEIDARGMLVTPGFVDPHTHYDAQATWSSRITPSSWNGVTTTLIGNCGVGFAPCKPSQRDMLVKLMEGVEDIPEVVLTEGLPWNWQSFPGLPRCARRRAATTWTWRRRCRTPRCGCSSWASAARIANLPPSRTASRWRGSPRKASRPALWVSPPRAR